MTARAMTVTTTRPRLIQMARAPASSVCTARCMKSALPGMLFFPRLPRLGWRLRGVHFVYFPVERAPADSEFFRRRSDVAIRGGQGLQDKFLFCLAQVQRTGFLAQTLAQAARQRLPGGLSYRCR